MKVVVLLSLTYLSLLFVAPVQATHQGTIHANDICRDEKNQPIKNPINSKILECETDHSCLSGYYPPTGTTQFFCQKNTSSSPGGAFPVFGKIVPPDALQGLGFGAQGLGKFLSTVIQLIYIVAGIAFVFMMIIAAFNWITSGGDKEKVGNAQKRITHAIIGIVLLAVTFVIIRLIGQITGFTFFAGQGTNISAPAATPTPPPIEVCQYSVACETSIGQKGFQTCNGAPQDTKRPYHPGSNPCKPSIEVNANCTICR